MKRLSLYLFLLLFALPTPSQADDIRDFQIEGMSIGDSLLDYYSSEDIELRVSQITNQGYKSDKFIRTNFKSGFGTKNFEIYDGIQVHFKKKDSTYKLHGLSGYFLIDKKSECIKKQNEVIKDLSEIFTSKPKYDAWEDEDGEYIDLIFSLDDGEIFIRCTIWNEEAMKKNNWTRNIRVGILLNELLEWLKTQS